MLQNCAEAGCASLAALPCPGAPTPASNIDDTPFGGCFEAARRSLKNAKVRPERLGHHNLFLFLALRFWAVEPAGTADWLVAGCAAPRMLARNKKLSIRAPTAAPNLRPR